MEILGVDIGGSGIKAAPVDVSTGQLAAARRHRPTPTPASPAAVGAVVRELVEDEGWTGPVGCAFPGPIVGTTVMTAVNLDPSWIGTDGAMALGSALGRRISLINDADAAGLAEARLGAARGRTGTILVLTFGTGIGSALFSDGVLVPNVELGEVPFGSETTELYASARTRTTLSLSFDAWAARVSEVLGLYEAIFQPGLFVIGGGISRDFEKFSPYLTCDTMVVPAHFGADAGIVGAAIHASTGHRSD